MAFNKVRNVRITPGTGELSFKRVGENKRPTIQETFPLEEKPSEELVFSKTIKQIDEEEIPFVVVSSVTKLKGERVITAGNGIILTDNGPNNSLLVAVDPNFIPSTNNVNVRVANTFIGYVPTLNFIGSNLEIVGINDFINNKVDLIFSAKQIPIFSVENLGTGQQFALGVSANREFNFRTLKGTGIIEVSTVGNEVVISASQFEIDNVGNGSGSLALNISANKEFKFRTISGSGIIEVSTVGNRIIISANDKTPTFTLSNLGGSEEIAIGVSANKDFKFRTIEGGGVVDVRTSGNNIIISAPTVPITILTSAFGSGAPIIIGVSGNNEILYRTIIGSNIDVQYDSNNIILSATQNVLPIFTLSNLGGSEEIAIGVSANKDFKFRTIEGGGVVDVRTSGNNIIISAPTVPITILTSAFGSGAPIIIGVSGNNEILYRTIIGSNIDVQYDSNNIILSSKPQIEDKIVGYGGSNYIYVSAPSSAIEMWSNSALAVIINKFGNVGIGTSNPNSKLEIYDVSAENTFIQFNNFNTGLSADTGSIIGLSGNSKNLLLKNLMVSGDIELDARSIIVYSVSGSYILPTSAGVSGQVLTSNGQNGKLYWSSVGQLSTNVYVSSLGSGVSVIGLVSGGNEIIQRTIIGTNISVSSTTSEIILSANIVGNFDRITGYGGSNYISASGQNNSLVFVTNSSNRLIITSAGMVGIGNNNPIYNFDLYSDNSSFIRISNQTTGTSANSGTVLGLLSGENNFVVNNNSNGNISLQIEGDTKLKVDDVFISFSNGYFNIRGDAEYKMAILKGTTSASVSGLQTYLFTKNSSTLYVPPFTVWSFEVDLLGKEQNGTISVCYRYKGLLKKDLSDSSIAFIGTVNEELISEHVSAFGWEGGVEVDTSEGSMRVFGKVSGYSGSNDISWLAVAKIIEINA